MPVRTQIKIRTFTIVAVIAVMTLAFGIMLDDRVIPDAKQPLITEEAVEQQKNKAAVKTEQTAQEQANDRREKQASEIKKLDQKAKATIEKADGLIAQADQLIAKAGLPKPTDSEAVSPQNENIAKRLAEVRGRLDKFKQ